VKRFYTVVSDYTVLGSVYYATIYTANCQQIQLLAAFIGC